LRERERVEFQKKSEIVLRKLLQNRSAILDSYPKGERERNGEIEFGIRGKISNKYYKSKWAGLRDTQRHTN